MAMMAANPMNFYSGGLGISPTSANPNNSNNSNIGSPNYSMAMPTLPVAAQLQQLQQQLQFQQQMTQFQMQMQQIQQQQQQQQQIPALSLGNSGSFMLGKVTGGVGERAADSMTNGSIYHMSGSTLGDGVGHASFSVSSNVSNPNMPSLSSFSNQGLLNSVANMTNGSPHMSFSHTSGPSLIKSAPSMSLTMMNQIQSQIRASND
eukprot:CAMPEP_0175045674 /NCGR_PEP_ID=MMETSP0052_2-20121109/4577_1 /TAXON_ID=51329 ORGANISM="Polytomella parva, Strain SAG 63-3" /NCGR_SAMPLE_ID=MMETSP0052_2 /ASSEMBLY_ACC=CAM_ASM_000194 /LENGTH=204 /DNA_ID=CAMNT_0016309277 /DNA_START=111 /DNA_END=722 /DNA_ORIENTATION=-